MIQLIVNLILIVVIVIDLKYMIQKKKRDEKLIKTYEELDKKMDKYLESFECEENNFEMDFKGV